jgi:hypothetical protein
LKDAYEDEMIKTQKIAAWKITIIRSIPPLPPLPPPDEKQAQNDGRNGGDTLPAVEVLSPLSEDIST